MKTICLFNHKGGVSKTTTTFNLGWSLAEKGKKVLMVDLDSQCNLTGLVLGYNAINDENMDSFYNSDNNLSMKTVASSIVDGMSPDVFLQIKKGDVFKTKNENLFLLAGHLDVSDLDAQISVSLKIAAGVPATKNIPGNLPAVLQEIAHDGRFDYVLYDLSPSVGGLNQVILMSSDYFIVPTSPDYYCLQAIGSLEKNIKKWHDEIESFKKMNDFGSNYAIKNQPIFIGTIQQRYRPRSDRPAKSFQLWIDRIRESVNNNLVPSLKSIGCLIDFKKFESIVSPYFLSPYDLAHVADFNSLIAISQHISKPVFALTNEEINEVGKVVGRVLQTMGENRDQFNKTFSDLAERVIKLTA